MSEQDRAQTPIKRRKNRQISKQNGTQVSTPQRPINDNTEAWKAYWKSQGQSWRTEPEIDVERQKYLAERRCITPDIEKGAYPFKDINLSRADVEWLLETHEDGGRHGPVDWSDKSQWEREGLDLRGADLRGTNLSRLPLARMRGGFTVSELEDIVRAWVRVTEEQFKTAIEAATVHLEKARLLAAHLEGAILTFAHLEEADLSQSYLARTDLEEAHLTKAHLGMANFGANVWEMANLKGADLKGALIGNAHLEGANLSRAHLEGAHLVEANLKEAHLHRVYLVGAVLTSAHLEKAWLDNAHLEGAKLILAHLEGAKLINVYLEGANLSRAHLEGADLFGARQEPDILEKVIGEDFFDLEDPRLHGIHLEGANLREAHLEGADLSSAHMEGKELPPDELERLRNWVKNFPEILSPADLRHAFFDPTTILAGMTIGHGELGSVRLADLHWGGADLTTVDWTNTKILGDECEAQREKDRSGKRKDSATRINDYRTAVRANRQLATALRDQGLNEEADRFAYRAQKLQQVVLRRQAFELQVGFWRRLRMCSSYVFSLFLDLLAGYGYHPAKTLFWYLLAIGGFATAYAVFGHLPPFPDAVVFSFTSFHGRGFFPSLAGETNLHHPLVVLAAVEAVTGLFIEISFIATFTQRFFGK